MNQSGEDKKLDMDGYELARKMREEAQALEDKERIKRRLLKLIEISEDPYYDQYLNQMLKDLDTGKATPRQVEKEANRTYRLYLQRMGKDVAPDVSEQVKQKDTVEFKVGAGIFSTVGAVFVLASLVIIGFNFLEGIGQGLCLYAASLAVILFSELIVKRLSRPFSLVITGIGISSLFISTVINYMVLKNMNGLVASVITLAIAVFSILFSRKKDATSIRLITIFGCYISFLPIKGFESELSFLIMTGMLLMINLASIFLPNQSNRSLISCVHIVAHTIFTGVVTGIVLSGELNIIYAAFFIITSLVLLNLIYWQQREENKLWLSIIFSVAIGFCAVLLIGVVGFDHNLSRNLELFYKILTEVMAVAVTVIFFILWGQKKERLIQYYFIAAVVVLFNGFSDYKWEVIISTLLVFMVTRILSVRIEELTVLDGILAVVTALQGLWVADEWYVILFVAVMLLSLFLLRRLVIFHEITVTVFLILVTLMGLDTDWTMPLCLGILLVLFLFCNHLPTLHKHNQLPYNIVNISLAGLLSICSVYLDEYWINAVAIVIGAAMIIIVFRKRYYLEVPKKYFILIGYLVYMILAAEFKTPVIVSAFLMLVAIACVGIGFWQKDKSYRICGLIMAVCVCLKLILFDFKELESLSKAILFLLVGIIALIISFLYIYVEKKEEQDETTVESITMQETINKSVPEQQKVKANEPISEQEDGLKDKEGMV